MRGLIKTSARLFIMLGAATAVCGVAFAIFAFMKGATSPYASYPELVGFLIAAAGAVSGASIVLVGGTAYLLSTIDERIEHVTKRPLAGREA